MSKLNKTSNQNQRKQTFWNKDKISQLIKLYRQHECLWNTQVEEYKSKDRRNKAIGEICRTLQISKFDFGKKIHNLRNQFNSEWKKLERRIEEAGGDAEEINFNAADGFANQRCRWEHFESLTFLRDVILPRTCAYQSPVLPPPAKKMRLKPDSVAESEGSEQNSSKRKYYDVSTAGGVTQSFVEAASSNEYIETATLSNDDDDIASFEDQEVDFQNFEEDSQKGHGYDRKYKPPQTEATFASSSGKAQTEYITITTTQNCSTTSPKYVTRSMQQQQPQHQHHQQQHSIQGPQNKFKLNSSKEQAQIIQIEDGLLPFIELEQKSRDVVEKPQQCKSQQEHPSGDSVVNCNLNGSFAVRDQWSAFGELIASEFRNLNSDISRKQLKRRIMQAMLEVGEEDDNRLNK